MRIVWYLERYHGIKTSDATVSRMLKRHGVNRLPRGTRVRKVHTKRYNKQVPGHHIQMDVKFLTFIGKQGEKIRRFEYTAIDDATRSPGRPWNKTTAWVEAASMSGGRTSQSRLDQLRYCFLDFDCVQRANP